MCKCSRLEFREVAFKATGERTIPYHKNCGEFLSDSQVKLVRDNEGKIWTALADRREKPASGSQGRMKALRCRICHQIVPSVAAYCPNCGSTDLGPELIRI